jgi:AraC-like DNA-binding protein
VLIGSNLPHYWRNDSSAAQPECFAHSLVIQFGEKCLGSGFLSRPELTGLRQLLVSARRGLHYPDCVAKQVAGPMRELRRLTGLNRVIGFLQVLGILLESPAPRPLSSPGFTAHLDQFAHERINRAYQYIFAHFAQPLEHGEIARQAGMSLSAFCHYFKRVTGRPLSDFINEVRVGHACRLLIDTEMTVAEAAFASGFGSLSNFNRRFKELTGTSPLEYRCLHFEAPTQRIETTN